MLCNCQVVALTVDTVMGAKNLGLRLIVIFIVDSFVSYFCNQ